MVDLFANDLMSARTAVKIEFISGFLLTVFYPEFSKLTDKRRRKLINMLSGDFYKFVGRHTRNDHKYQRI